MKNIRIKLKNEFETMRILTKYKRAWQNKNEIGIVWNWKQMMKVKIKKKIKGKSMYFMFYVFAHVYALSSPNLANFMRTQLFCSYSKFKRKFSMLEYDWFRILFHRNRKKAQRKREGNREWYTNENSKKWKQLPTKIMMKTNEWRLENKQ